MLQVGGDNVHKIHASSVPHMTKHGVQNDTVRSIKQKLLRGRAKSQLEQEQQKRTRQKVADMWQTLE